MKEEKSPKRSIAVPAAGTVVRTARGMQLFVQDLFKLKVAKRLFNTSYKAYQPHFLEQEHTHFYRSVDDKGMVNKYSTAIGNHFHEIKVEWNPDGTLKTAWCGPALERRVVTMPGSKRKVTRTVSISFKKEVETGDGVEVQEIVDDHTHEMQYIHTDEFSLKGKEELRQRESEKVKSLMSSQMLNRAAAQAQPQPNPQKDNLIETE